MFSIWCSKFFWTCNKVFGLIHVIGKITLTTLLKITPVLNKYCQILSKLYYKALLKYCQALLDQGRTILNLWYYVLCHNFCFFAYWKNGTHTEQTLNMLNVSIYGFQFFMVKIAFTLLFTRFNFRFISILNSTNW